MSQDAVAIMNAVKSENLLAGSALLTQIEDLRTSLQYKSDNTLFSYDDYFLVLQKQIEGIAHINLETEIAPGTESQYQIQLIMGLEEVFDDCERVLIKLLSFQSKLLVAQERMETLKASFVAWYALAAQQYLASYDIDLSKVVIADLAKAEFERLIGGLDVEVNSLIAAVGVQVKTVNKRRQTAEQKFNLGKDQANAVWTGSLLPANVGTSSDARGLLDEEPEEEDEDEVPAFVSKDPKVGTQEPKTGSTMCEHFREPIGCPDCLAKVRGVFVKRGDPVIAEVIGETGNGNKMEDEGGPAL
ncbi:MAG: hypothetical protein WBE13_13120 [Candidatus Acidiferrum sp.]